MDLHYDLRNHERPPLFRKKHAVRDRGSEWTKFFTRYNKSFNETPMVQEEAFQNYAKRKRKSNITQDNNHVAGVKNIQTNVLYVTCLESRKIEINDSNIKKQKRKCDSVCNSFKTREETVKNIQIDTRNNFKATDNYDGLPQYGHKTSVISEAKLNKAAVIPKCTMSKPNGFSKQLKLKIQYDSVSNSFKTQEEAVKNIQIDTSNVSQIIATDGFPQRYKTTMISDLKLNKLAVIPRWTNKPNSVSKKMKEKRKCDSVNNSFKIKTQEAVKNVQVDTRNKSEVIATDGLPQCDHKTSVISDSKLNKAVVILSEFRCTTSKLNRVSKKMKEINRSNFELTQTENVAVYKCSPTEKPEPGSHQEYMQYIQKFHGHEANPDAIITKIQQINDRTNNEYKMIKLVLKLLEKDGQKSDDVYTETCQLRDDQLKIMRSMFSSFDISLYDNYLAWLYDVRIKVD